MKRFICVMVAMVTLLQATEEEIVIDSGFAEYDGKRMILSKDVVVDHEIGKISANKIILIPSEEAKKKLNFAFLEMKDAVKISMKEGGKLDCASAELDYLKLVGKFYGDDLLEYVVYSEECSGKGDVKIPLKVKARQMVLYLEREVAEHGKAKTKINRIDASREVIVDYNQDLIANADYGTYQRLPYEETNQETMRLSGEIILSRGDSPESICRVTNQSGDRVDSKQIRIDTVKRTFYFTNPNGVFLFDSKGDSKERVDFSSDRLIWDDRRDLLTLRDHISVNQLGIGKLRSDREVQIFHYKKAGKRKIRTIESSGETILEHIDPNKNFTHTLIAYGLVTVDHEQCKTVIESPRDLDGNVPEGQQVFFHDRLGEIYADKVILEYEEVNRTLSPSKLTLEGNIRLLNRSSVNQEETEAFLQYALADRVEFYPKLNEMTMSAVKPSRVLFLDKVNNLQISAPKVKIKRDLAMNKESIQGEGDVRFCFVDKELEKLKKHFTLGAGYE